MKKLSYNLKDTTFLIYVRIDSVDRLLNLELVLKHISLYFQASIYLLNSTSENKFVHHYNGSFFNVSREYRDMYSEIGNYDFLLENERNYLLWFKYSVGGVFGGFTKALKKTAYR